MAETDSTDTTGAPAQTEPVAASQTSQETSKVDSIELPKAAFEERIRSARKAAVSDAMASLGVDSLDALKELVSAHKSAEEGRKSDAEKTAEKLASLGAEASKAKAYQEAVSSYSEAEMSLLTDAQRESVRQIAGDDSALQLKTIAALKPTWSASTSTPAPVIADTAPSTPLPPEAVVSSPANPKEIAASMRDPSSPSFNPFLAAHYSLSHAREVYPE
jgi:hypothetical protein